MTVDVAAALAPWLAARLGAGEVAVTDLRRHAEGFSWQTWTLTASWSDGDGEHRRGFAVRREPEDGLLAPYDVAGQYRLHAALREHSAVPVPALLGLETDAAVLGMPFYVMDRVSGVVPVQWRGDDPAIFPDAATRRAIGRAFVDALAAVHGVGWEAAGLGFLGVPASPQDAALRQVDHWERFYADAVLVEEPLVREAFGWLRRHTAVSGRVGLCHGDYRIGNVMLDGTRIVAVFDWELAHLGDPVADIAWSALPLFRGRSPLFSQLLAPDEFLARYAERTGLEVDDDVFRFWTVLGLVKAIAPHLRAARAFEDRRSDDVRLAAMGHQALHPLRMLARELG